MDRRNTGNDNIYAVPVQASHFSCCVLTQELEGTTAGASEASETPEKPPCVEAAAAPNTKELSMRILV